MARLALLIPPQYLEQPQDLRVLEGETAVFRAVISGSPTPFGFRWEYGDTALTNMVLSTPHAELVIPNVRFVPMLQGLNSGNYRQAYTGLKNVIALAIGMSIGSDVY